EGCGPNALGLLICFCHATITEIRCGSSNHAIVGGPVMQECYRGTREPPGPRARLRGRRLWIEPRRSPDRVAALGEPPTAAQSRRNHELAVVCDAGLGSFYALVFLKRCLTASAVWPKPRKPRRQPFQVRPRRP